MQKILVLGAGKSSYFLLEYLSTKAVEKNWQIMACDRDNATLSSHVSKLKNVHAILLEIDDENALNSLIQNSNIVISLLPPALHPHIAKKCLNYHCHLATASYVSAEMKLLDKEAKKKDLIFINELGLDPGIDHLSAMKMLDEIKSKGGKVTSFESYCGGLVLEADCEGNPWKYKFSWNPMNVILAGQGGMSVYRKEGLHRYFPWHQLFANAGKLSIPDIGEFDFYANRDSIGYEKVYGLDKSQTLLRGTLRRSGFCEAWQVLVELGFTDNTTSLHPSIQSVGALSAALTGKAEGLSLSQWLLDSGKIEVAQKPWFDFINLDNKVNLVLDSVTPAGLLRMHLEDKWKLNSSDRDEIIMYHKVQYSIKGKNFTKEATLQVTGKDNLRTAMAKTVGLPLAMGVELVLDGEIKDRGVCIPVKAEWYRKILPKLEEKGIKFIEYGA